MAHLTSVTGQNDINIEIARLRGLEAPELRQIWRSLTGRSNGPGLRGELLQRALVHLVQEQAHGALSPVWHKRIALLAREGEKARGKAADNAAATKARAGIARRRKIMPGARLVREWHGKIHEVVVTADGFLWNSTAFTSLSTIALEITGTSWNGWVFFGVTLPRRRAPESGNGASTHLKPGKGAAPVRAVHA